MTLPARDTDFAAYLAARWTPVVRTLVLLGGPQQQAEAVASTGFARCSARWGRLRDSRDVEAEVYRTVLECWTRRTWVEPDAPPADVPIEARLDRLTPDVRAAVVLRYVAGLSDVQVAQVLDRPPAETMGDGTEDPDEEAFRRAGDAIDVPLPPIEAVTREARERRRRTVRRVLASAGALAAVGVAVGVATAVGVRPGHTPAAGEPQVTRVENVAEVAWWANGLLHLPHVTVALNRLDGLVAIGEGAVVGDEQGGVSYVADDGTLTSLGNKEPGAPLVASDEQGWAAWVDPDGDAPKLVVYDVTARQVLATRTLSSVASDGLADGAHPIAMDRDTLYFTTTEGDWEWRLPDGEPEGVDPGHLAEVGAGIRVWEMDPRTIKIVQPFFSLAFAVRGSGAGTQVSDNGTYVLTRLGRSPDDPFGRVRIYDARSGHALWTGLRARDTAVAATLGPFDEVTYVVARSDDAPQAGEFLRQSFSGPYELRTCHIGERTCFTVTSFPHTGAQPVLPH
ncbi:MAG: hypothetical protein JWN22_3799 [Nocardioides sp.]|nr:hypothetical protein [Nocardioides sp.]